MGNNIHVIKARFIWTKIQKMESLDIKRAALFQNCRGKYYSKADEMVPELLEEYGYLKVITPEYKGVAGLEMFVSLLILQHNKFIACCRIQ